MPNQGLAVNRLFAIRRRGSAMKGCMISALVVFMLLLVGAGIGTYLVIKNGRGWVASASEKVMVAMVDESHMPASEKDEVKVIISQFRSDFEDKIITLDDFGRIVEELTESPLMPAMIAGEAYGNYYDENEDLTPAEKTEAELELSRVARAVFEETMTTSEMLDVLDPINAQTGSSQTGIAIQIDGTNIELKVPEDCTVEELRQVTLNARAAADEAGVPNEVFSIDASDEIQRVIDKVMGKISSSETLLNTPALAAPDEIENEAVEVVEDAAGDPAADGVEDDGP